MSSRLGQAVAAMFIKQNASRIKKKFSPEGYRATIQAGNAWATGLSPQNSGVFAAELKDIAPRGDKQSKTSTEGKKVKKTSATNFRKRSRRPQNYTPMVKRQRARAKLPSTRKGSVLYDGQKGKNKNQNKLG